MICFYPCAEGEWSLRCCDAFHATGNQPKPKQPKKQQTRKQVELSRASFQLTHTICSSELNYKSVSTGVNPDSRHFTPWWLSKKQQLIVSAETAAAIYLKNLDLFMSEACQSFSKLKHDSQDAKGKDSVTEDPRLTEFEILNFLNSESGGLNSAETEDTMNEFLDIGTEIAADSGAS